MHQVANRHDFHQLNDDQQDKHAALLRHLHKLRMPCRCEMHGRDFIVVVGPGLPPAKHWLDRLDLEET